MEPAPDNLEPLLQSKGRSAAYPVLVRGLAPGAAARPFSFFDLKGDVEALLAPFSHWTLYYDAPAADYYHPGRSAHAVMDGTTMAQFGHEKAALNLWTIS